MTSPNTDKIAGLIAQIHQQDFQSVINNLHSASLGVLRVSRYNLTDQEKETFHNSMLMVWAVINEELNRKSPGKNETEEPKIPDSVKTGRFSSKGISGTRGDVISKLSSSDSLDPLVLVRPYYLDSDLNLKKPAKTRYIIFEPVKTKLTKHTFESYTVNVNGSMNFNFRLNDTIFNCGMFYIFLPAICPMTEDLLASFIRKGWGISSDPNILDMFERVISQREKFQ